MKNKTIDLVTYTGKSQRVLSGRDKGEAMRKKLKLDELEKQFDNIEIEVREFINVINSSYFLGLFEDSILEMGEDRFRKKYKFKCSDPIKVNVENGIRYALLSQTNVLGGKKG